MSHFTFNIADYRPMTDAHNLRDSSQLARRQAGFVIVSPARTADVRPAMALAEAEPLDIRQVRDMQRPHRGVASCVYQRRAKVLRFTGSVESAVTVMPAPAMTAPASGEFGSLDLPPAA